MIEEIKIIINTIKLDIVIIWFALIPIASNIDYFIKYSESRHPIVSAISRCIIGWTLVYCSSGIIKEVPEKFYKIAIVLIVANSPYISAFMKKAFLKYFKKEVNKKFKNDKN